jgi:hypothetical protein
MNEQWCPINTAPEDRPLWLFDPTLIDLDFNPTGTFDGHWQDDEGWVAAVWCGCHDTWNYTVINPTHWMQPTMPNGAVD